LLALLILLYMQISKARLLIAMIWATDALYAIESLTVPLPGSYNVADAWQENDRLLD
jgi:hypothetical protein